MWQKNLNLKCPKEKLIKTLICGILSSGDQSECALRETAAKFKSDFPDPNRIIQKVFYVYEYLP